MSENAAAEPKPLLPVDHIIKLPEDAAPFLQGQACSSCGHVSTDKRIACPACFSRDSLSPKTLSSTGKVLAFTVVRRSFPGLPVPFISAIVALDGGGDIKVNLENIDADSDAIAVGLAVEVIYHKAPWGDEHGNEYMVYAVQPADETLREKTGAAA
jgi:uncharacterized OB-fold protein